MHDTTDFERRGLPALFVASSEFQEAARTQAAALGFDPAVVYVAHPIQDRTDAEMRGLADGVVGEIVANLSATFRV